VYWAAEYDWLMDEKAPEGMVRVAYVIKLLLEWMKSMVWLLNGETETSMSAGLKVRIARVHWVKLVAQVPSAHLNGLSLSQEDSPAHSPIFTPQ
jgi:hypothetical protein